MRKGVLISVLLILLLVVTGNLFADVRIDAASAVTIVFTYEDSAASKVNIAGDFQGWNADSTPMEKDENGIWTYSVEAERGDVLLYKFVVDGEWITDPGAPDTVDDGFGGKNGRLVVDAVIAMQAGDAEAAAAASASGGLNFSTTFKLRSDNRFLTRDLAVGDVSGYEFNSSVLVSDSYWNIAGSIMDGLDLSLELKALSGSTTLYEANALGSRIPYTTFTDGMQSLGSLFFSPVTSLNGAIPSVNKLALAYEGEYIGFRTAVAAAKSSVSNVLYDVVKASDANDGLLEISTGEGISQLGPISLNATIGLTAQNGGHGVYSFATLGIMDLLDVTLNYNVHSPSSELFRFNEDFGNAAAIAVSSTLFDLLTVKGQYLLSFGPNDTLDEQAMAGAFQATIDLDDLYDAQLTLKYGGDNAYTIFGDDGHLEKGLFRVDLAQSTQAIELLKAGLNYTLWMDNFDEIADSEMQMSFQPYADVFLSKVLPLDLTVKLYGNMRTYRPSTEVIAEQFTVFAFHEGGLQLAWSGISDFLKSVTLDYGINMAGDGDDVVINLTDKVVDLGTIYNTIALRTSMDRGLSANAAAIIRTNSDSADDSDTDVPFGFGIGASWATEFEALNKPTLDLNYTWNADPFDGASSSIDFNDNYVFRVNNIAGNAGESFLRFGIVWSF